MRQGRDPEDMRSRLLRAAFQEFYVNGFQGGRLDRIVERAEATKGALFHHFRDKNELGYAVLDEMIQPVLKERWVDPLSSSINPIADLKAMFRRRIAETAESGSIVRGCPLNNLAQEMSPLDEGFRLRIEKCYEAWREALAAALARGIKEGRVRKQVSPKSVATLVVAAQMGIWGTAKSSQNKELMIQAGEALCTYLDSLRSEH